jgi:hypothetical protein
MADFRVSFRSSGSASSDMAIFKSEVGKAASAAIRQCGEIAISNGRANIASAGFSDRWQNALEASVSSRSVFVHHTIPYSDIFETGGVIRGSPLLWIPLSTTPKTIDGKKTTPQLWVQRYGQLVLGKRGTKPFLFGKLPGSTRSTPIFVGVDSVTIGKKFDIEGVCRRAADELPALYEASRK